MKIAFMICFVNDSEYYDQVDDEKITLSVDVLSRWIDEYMQNEKYNGSCGDRIRVEAYEIDGDFIEQWELSGSDTKDEAIKACSKLIP